MTTGIGLALERLEAVIADESHALRAGNTPVLADIIARKNQCLLELSRLARRTTADSIDGATRGRLNTLRQVLAENARLLDMHVRASSELARMIADTITAEDSDGTYSAATTLQRRSA